MREPLTVAVAQPLCVSYEVAANAETHAAYSHVIPCGDVGGTWPEYRVHLIGRRPPQGRSLP